MSDFSHRVVTVVKRFAEDERGNDAVEYGLILGLVSLMIVAGATIAGTSLQTLFNTAGTELQTAAG